ncbi:tyrosine-type recombinase/integrase [Leisingera sp. ANG59]|nr:tyrosine-type recombinase/integrase [Leisingera sp. ANG59]
MKYNEQRELWEDNGREYILNEFDPRNPVYIEVHEDRWVGNWLNDPRVLVWPRTLDPDLRSVLSLALRRRLTRYAPNRLERLSAVLGRLATAQERAIDEGRIAAPYTVNDLHDPKIVRDIWSAVPPANRPYLRTLVADLIETAGRGDLNSVVVQMRSWKANRKLAWGQDVLHWHPEIGSLTSAELEILRTAIARKPLEDELPRDHALRLILRIALTLLRRTSQIALIKADAIRREESAVGVTTSLRVPLIKGQTGAEERYEPVPIDLAEDIEAFRCRPEVKSSPIAREMLLPLPSTRELAGDHAIRPSARVLNRLIRGWFNARRIISPRTGEPMRMTITRIRHTGATHLAMQGVALEVIQDVLQHDNPYAAHYYIDAVGAEYLPAFEKADRNLGGRFSMIRDAFFKGRIASPDEPPDQPIIVPDAQAPAIVGACASGAACPVHPLFSCYSCEHFLAFRDADHQRALDYIEAEADRWREAEGQTARSKALKDFDRIAAGVQGAIDAIARERGEN